MRAAVHLRVVRDVEPEASAERPAPARRVPDPGEVVLVAALFLLNLVPVAGELAGVGRWSPAIVGFAALALLLAGRELWAQLGVRLRRARGREEEPP